MVNEFEVKTFKEGLKSLGVVEVQSIPEEYNFEEFGVNVIDVIIDYKYKNVDFIAYYSFGSDTMKESLESQNITKAQHIKKELTQLIQEVERIFFSGANASEVEDELKSILSMQIELLYAKKLKPIPRDGDVQIDKINQKLEKEIQKETPVLEIYKKIMKLAEKEAQK